MTSQDKLELQNMITTCDLAIEGLRVFKAWLMAWQSHPLTGKLPADLVDDVIDDLKRAGLESWVFSQAMWKLRKIVCGEIEE